MATAEPSAPQPPLTPADYSEPTLECDVVMKGGITSGVVYPLAVCELAKTYRFRCIGGTSAGAIAAAATAAAEYGRMRPGATSNGFRELADLPGGLGRTNRQGRSNLFALFQPQPELADIFHVATSALGDARGRLPRFLGQLFRRFPAGALAGVLFGGWIGFIAAREPSWLAAATLSLLAVLVAAGVALGWAVWRLLVQVRERVPANGFGLCSGNGPDVDEDRGPAALTPWLADLLNQLAGKPRADGPLTVGDLWGPPNATGERDIDLRFMTTNLTHGRPYELPFSNRQFFYDPDEFAKYFPEWVLRGMNDRGKARKAETPARRALDEEEDADDAPTAAAETTRKRPPDPGRVADADRRWKNLLPFPEPRDLPVVVAARMSLSFPVLISAVPLYAVDYMLDVPDEERVPEKCWFSDGGICSNFPVHFFDSPLPARPTFGINLRPFPQDRKKQADEAMNTWFPRKNNEGIVEWFAHLGAGAKWTSLAGFAGLIVNAMQNWVDNTQLRVPGFRDRVAHVLLDEKEGGLNLNMPAPVIVGLSERGRMAARELARRYDPLHLPEEMPLTWDNHRWVRLLSSMHLLEELLRDVTDQYDAPDPSGRTYAQLVLRGKDEPRSYRMSEARATELDQAIRELQSLGFLQGAPLLDKRAPNPRPELRIRPRL
jgi:predicted acylesterase/phospholipase RssA